MYPLKPLLLSCLFSTPISRADVFSSMMESMNQHMQQMEEHMKHMENMMQTRQGLSATSAITSEISENDQNVQVQLKGIKSDKELNAIAGDSGNQLTIQTPQGTITLRTRDRLLTLEVTQKEEHKQENKGLKSTAYSMSSSSSSQLLKNKVSLDDVSVEYNQDMQILTIIIPKDMGKNIPITIKKK